MTGNSNAAWQMPSADGVNALPLNLQFSLALIPNNYTKDTEGIIAAQCTSNICLKTVTLPRQLFLSMFDAPNEERTTEFSNIYHR